MLLRSGGSRAAVGVEFDIGATRRAELAGKVQAAACQLSDDLPSAATKCKHCGSDQTAAA